MVKRIRAIWGNFQPSNPPAWMACFVLVLVLGSSSVIHDNYQGSLFLSLWLYQLCCVSAVPGILATESGWVSTRHTQERGHLEQMMWGRWPDPANSTLIDPQHPLASEERGWLPLRALSCGTHKRVLVECPAWLPSWCFTSLLCYR